MLALALALLVTPSAAIASSSQVAMFQEDMHLRSDPQGTLATLHDLGVGMVRVSVWWNTIAPAPNARTMPRGFKGADPASYPADRWAPYDAIVKAARDYGISVDFSVTSPAPQWATGPGAPRNAPGGVWKPSASAYGQFVQALGIRYSGSYHGLPRVSHWEVWNEPNFGPDLGPQANSNSTVLVAAPLYRGLVDAAWAALVRTGHSRDTTILGNFDARGTSGRPSRFAPQGFPGYFSATKPLVFLRALYCVDSAYRPLRGTAARGIGCPTTAAGTRAFRAAHPGLFSASAFADHPYAGRRSPAVLDSKDPDFIEFPEIPRFAADLARLQRVYGSRRQFPIYDNEFGYITNPPNRTNVSVNPATAAYYLNWAEYLSWRTSSLASYMQYLLYDPNPTVGVPEYGGFATGLLQFDGTAQPTYAAYRLPVYLPVGSTRRGRTLELWGCARPAHAFAQPQVEIQFQRGSRGPFTTLKTIAVTDSHGYFDLRLGFPASGSVRLAWTYPGADPTADATAAGDAMAGQTVYSRTVKVTVT